MENVSIKDSILEKKMDSYHFNRNDYEAKGELMVNITLGEYRDLIKSDAQSKSKIESIEHEKRVLTAEKNELLAEISRLKDAIANQYGKVDNDLKVDSGASF